MSKKPIPISTPIKDMTKEQKEETRKELLALLASLDAADNPVAPADKHVAAPKPKLKAPKPPAEELESKEDTSWRFQINNPVKVIIFSPENQDILNREYAKKTNKNINLERQEIGTGKPGIRLVVNFNNTIIALKSSNGNNDNYAVLIPPIGKPVPFVAPKPEVPKPEVPKPEAPKPEAPKPKPEAPKPEAPKPEVPKPEIDPKVWRFQINNPIKVIIFSSENQDILNREYAKKTNKNINLERQEIGTGKPGIRLVANFNSDVIALKSSSGDIGEYAILIPPIDKPVPSTVWKFQINNPVEIIIFSPENQVILNTAYATKTNKNINLDRQKINLDKPDEIGIRLVANFNNTIIALKSSGGNNDNYAVLISPIDKQVPYKAPKPEVPEPEAPKPPKPEAPVVDEVPALGDELAIGIVIETAIEPAQLEWRYIENLSVPELIRFDNQQAIHDMYKADPTKTDFKLSTKTGRVQINFVTSQISLKDAKGNYKQYGYLIFPVNIKEMLEEDQIAELKTLQGVAPEPAVAPKPVVAPKPADVEPAVLFVLSDPNPVPVSRTSPAVVFDL